MVKLPQRLQTIADMVPISVVADVGSDHGKLMIHLFESGKIMHGYAIENKKGPFEHLKKAIFDAGLQEEIIPLFSDGISELPPCVGTVVIAGMGGDNICQILLSHKEKLKNVQTIIIDAHSNVKDVRETIVRLGFVIAEEKMVKEKDIYYEIIKFIRGKEAIYNDEDLEYGPSLRREQSALFKEKYQSRVDEISRLLLKKLPENRIDNLQKEKDRILGIINEKQSIINEIK